MYVHHVLVWCPRKVSDSLELGLAVVVSHMWILVTKPESFARATSALNHRATSLVPKFPEFRRSLQNTCQQWTAPSCGVA